MEISDGIRGYRKCDERPRRAISRMNGQLCKELLEARSTPHSGNEVAESYTCKAVIHPYPNQPEDNCQNPNVTQNNSVVLFGQQAENTREAALAEIESMDSSDDIYEESSSSPKISEDLTVDEEEEPTAKKSKRIKKGDVISYLQQKQEIETGLKKEELLLRKLEAENRLLELTLAKEKQEMDFKIKQAELEMQQQAQKAQNEEKCTLTKALIEVISKRHN
ncbi:unnamed protein product [Allacma fusca]|uniref:Uncharacterized protein n=1 Tax=Allacma fusca TaxID=39272 RepID=A0A8J2MEW0_9HEXA|nr:unnamed protein product [Allacma fusca]